MQTFEERQRYVGAPKGWEAHGEAHSARVGDAVVEVEWQKFKKAFRKVERNALISGTEYCERITADPGERVKYSTHRVANGFQEFVSVDFGLAYLEKDRDGTKPLSTGFYPVKRWPNPFAESKERPRLQGVDLWAVFVRASDHGFKGDDLRTAFSDDAPLAELRAAAKAEIESHVDGLALPDRMPYFTRVAQAGILEAFDVGVLGPYVGDEFGRQLDQRLSSRPIEKLAQLVDQLTK